MFNNACLIEQVDVDHADEPGNCPSPSDNVPEFGSVCHMNFSSGPAKGKFCWERQPKWSAYRESSFGHGILEVVNSTYALWTWHRNQDMYQENSLGDQIYIVRQPELCLAGSEKNGVSPTLPPSNAAIYTSPMLFYLAFAVAFLLQTFS